MRNVDCKVDEIVWCRPHCREVLWSADAMRNSKCIQLALCPIGMIANRFDDFWKNLSPFEIVRPIGELKSLRTCCLFPYSFRILFCIAFLPARFLVSCLFCPVLFELAGQILVWRILAGKIQTLLPHKPTRQHEADKEWRSTPLLCRRWPSDEMKTVSSALRRPGLYLVWISYASAVEMASRILSTDSTPSTLITLRSAPSFCRPS